MSTTNRTPESRAHPRRRGLAGTSPSRALAAAALGAAALGAALTLIPGAGRPHAQALAAQPAPQSVAAQRTTLALMSRPISIDLREQRLGDVLSFIQELTGADLQVNYLSDNEPDGLDPDQPVTLKVTNVSALTLLERILERATGDFGQPGDNAWQLTPEGTMQIGTKESLNRYRRLEIYDIKDLLFIQPDFEEAPDFDLNSVLQSQGGGQSPFQDQGTNDDLFPEETDEERAQPIIDIITSLVEPDEWLINGGDAATIRFWQGALIVNAPDYIHRQINGYPWWSGGVSRTTNPAGRRYVSLNLDAAQSQITDFARDPVVIPATVGGPATPDN